MIVTGIATRLHYVLIPPDHYRPLVHSLVQELRLHGDLPSDSGRIRIDDLCAKGPLFHVGKLKVDGNDLCELGPQQTSLLR